tara:strand:+ start:149 stop:1930 length:1782 start_codon:yes stop_codon:yes gene_type:complete
MAIYGQSEGSSLTGTVTLTADDATVAGVGTLFSTELITGSEIIFNQRVMVVKSIASATSLELTANWTAAQDQAIGFALEDGTVDTSESATSDQDSDNFGGSIIIDNYEVSGHIIAGGEKVLNETQSAIGGIQAFTREMPKFLTQEEKKSVLGINYAEQSRSNDSVLAIRFNANSTSNGSGGSGYSGQPTISVAAPATFTFDPTVDTDGDGELTLENANHGGLITFTDHGFSMGSAVNYTDGGGTVMAGLVENNIYYVIPANKDSFRLAAEYGGFREESQYAAFGGTFMVEDGTVGNCEGTEDAHIGASLIFEFGGPVDTTSQTTIADTGFVNITSVGAGVAHTFIGQTGTASPSFIEVGIRLESGASEDDAGDFLLLDGTYSDSSDASSRLLLGGGSIPGTYDNASDVDPDFVIGHLADSDILLTGSGYSHSTITTAPVITVSAPTAKTFNAASAVAGDTITVVNHGFVPDDSVTYSRNSGTVIAELTDGGTFFIVATTEDTLKLSATLGGSAITMTDGASENHTLTGETATATAILGPGGARGSSVAHTGWTKVTVGTGGRAGRVHYETLVAGGITGDAGNSNDSIQLTSGM